MKKLLIILPLILISCSPEDEFEFTDTEFDSTGEEIEDRIQNYVKCGFGQIKVCKKISEIRYLCTCEVPHEEDGCSGDCPPQCSGPNTAGDCFVPSKKNDI